MPRLGKLEQTVIYHIRHRTNKSQIIFIGATTNFYQAKHTFKYKFLHDDTRQAQINEYIKKHGGIDDFEIVPVKQLNLNNKVEMVIALNEEKDNASKLYDYTEHPV